LFSCILIQPQRKQNVGLYSSSSLALFASARSFESTCMTCMWQSGRDEFVDSIPQAHRRSLCDTHARISCSFGHRGLLPLLLLLPRLSNRLVLGWSSWIWNPHRRLLPICFLRPCQSLLLPAQCHLFYPARGVVDMSGMGHKRGLSRAGTWVCPASPQGSEGGHRNSNLRASSRISRLLAKLAWRLDMALCNFTLQPI
jgi:hypothetical protein